jgi:hypothetical protein
MQRASNRFLATLVSFGAAVALSACSGGAPGTTGAPVTGLSSNQAPAVTGAPGHSEVTGGGGAGGDYCSLFTTDEIGAVLGTKVGVANQNPDPNTCVWFTSDGTTVLLKKDTADTCTGDESLVEAQGGGQIQGSTFVGPAIAGAVIAGTVVNGACYEAVVANGPTPKLDALANLLQQFIQRVGA